ncbi:MAG: M20/M25/M40 family metallo-hydrolase [Lachnospiraceae bacterium]
MNKQFLHELLSTDSVSGHEIGIQKKVINYMTKFVDEIRTDYTGNVISVVNPDSPVRILLSGHIDEIGLMVTHIQDNGMLKVASVGGIKVREYPGHKVRVCTEKGYVYGMVVTNSSIYKDADLKVSGLIIDIGADSKEEAAKYVRIGDTVIFDTDYRELVDDKICARAIDDRAGAFIILEATKRAKERGCGNGIYCVTSVGEETTMRGASWAAEGVEPTMGIAVDVTYATDYEGTNVADTGDVRLGAGPVLCNSTIISKKINDLLKEAAKRADIPYQVEAAVGRTGTDIDKIHFAGKGVPTSLVSLPLRYMHSPAEMGSYKDIEACINLLTEFLLLVNDNTDLDPFHV